MQGLLDFVKTPEGQGLLSAAFGGLAGAQRGAPINSIGRAGVAGLTGYGNALERQDQQAQLAKRNELFDVQMSALKADAAEKERLRQLERQRQAALPGLFAGTVTPGGISVPEIGGVEMFSQGPKVEQASVRSGAGQFNVPEAIRTGLFKAEEIKQYADLANIGVPEVARTIEVDDGKGGKATLQLDKFGRAVGQNLPAYIAPVQVNRGDRVDFVRPAPGVSLGMNMTPGERASDARARERLTFDREKAAEGTWQYDATRGGRVNAATGEFRPVMQDGVPLGGKNAGLTEGQGKANLFGSRMVEANRILSEMENPETGDTTYSRLGVANRLGAQNLPLIGGVAGGIANLMVSPEVQKAEQAQRDFINAVLRRESGAVIGVDEFNSGRQQYFPQPGDSKEVVLQKRRNRDMAIRGIEAEVPGGFRSTDATPPPPKVGAVVDGHRFMGGNPGDRNNWRKL